jgi:hypothetical protein
MSDRKKIEVTVDSSILNGRYDTINISDLLDKINNSNINKNLLYLELIIEEDYGGYEYYRVELKHKREETNEEYNIRLAKEKEYSDRRKQIELEQYLKLKSKFESTEDK